MNKALTTKSFMVPELSRSTDKPSETFEGEKGCVVDHERVEAEGERVEAEGERVEAEGEKNT